MIDHTVAQVCALFLSSFIAMSHARVVWLSPTSPSTSLSFSSFPLSSCTSYCLSPSSSLMSWTTTKRTAAEELGPPDKKNSSTHQSTVEHNVTVPTALNLPRSGSGVAGGGSRFCSRTMSWLPITTTVSPSSMRLASEQLVACAHNQEIVHVSQENDVARVCTWNTGQEVPPEQETFASQHRCKEGPRLEPPVKVGAHRGRMKIWGL